jgi:hypothetical protein
VSREGRELAKNEKALEERDLPKPFGLHEERINSRKGNAPLACQEFLPSGA